MGKNNKKLFQEANKYLVAGVNSPVRAFNYVGNKPLLIKSGKAAKIYGYDGKSYIDYVLSWGSAILGHAFTPAVEAVKKAANNGFSFGATNASEIELAKIIHQAIPLAQKIRFVNSGTEAVMGALRLARGYTKRDKIVKFTNSYHGHADYLLASSGSGLATLGIPLSKGVPLDFIKHTIVIPYGDRKSLDAVFKKYEKQIAAVIFEPVGGNFGVIRPDIEYLKYLRRITKRHGALLIADEIISGFRFGFGSLSQKLGIKPDLICLGKIIGAGLPVGAYAGLTKIMDLLAPKGEVYQASTFAGNPIVMQAGIAALQALEKAKKDYSRLSVYAGYLKWVIEKRAQLSGIPVKVAHYGSMFSLKFKEKKAFIEFYKKLLEQGIYFAQSEFETNFISFAHTKEDITKTSKAIKKAFGIIRKG